MNFNSTFKPEDSVHAYINLYQKNPRIVLRDWNYQELVLSYLVLMDENHKFIISQCNNEMHLNTLYLLLSYRITSNYILNNKLMIIFHSFLYKIK